MEKTNRLVTLAAAAVLAGTTGGAFAQDVAVPVETTTTAPAFDFKALAALFADDGRPTKEELDTALMGSDLKVTRLSYRGDGEIRVRLVDADGQRIRLRIEDGEVRYRIRPASDSSDTSDSNGDTSDSNGSSTGSSDANGPTSGGSNGGSSGGSGGNGGGSND